MFSNISIAKRLLVLIGSLLAFMAVIGISSVVGLSKSSHGLQSIYENNTVPLVQLGEVLDGLYHARALVITGMGADGSTAADVQFNQISKANEVLNKTWGAYKLAQVANGAKAQASTFDQAWLAYVESDAKVVTLARSGDYEAASSHMKTESAQRFDTARATLLKLMQLEKDHAKSSFEASSTAATFLNTAVLAMLALGLGIGGWLSYAITRSIIAPLNLMRATIGDVEKTTDFSKRVPVDSADEVGQTARSFNELMAVLQASFSIVLNNVAQISDSAHRLSSSARQVAASSEQDSTDAAAMAATIEEITVSVSHISDSARQASRLANQSGDISVEGGEIIRKAAAEMTQIANTVRNTSQTIEELGQRSNQISSIVQVIKDVADQTNLLALNAAIEAARAGEQGRGFAVVADEVRKLAERTTKATEEITQMISAIQSSAHTAVNTMGGAMQQVDGGVALAHRAGESIDQIRGSANHVIEVVNEISAALVEQSSASNSIAGHVEKVAQNTEKNSVAATESAAAAQRVDALAASMRDTVSRFKI